MPRDWTCLVRAMLPRSRKKIDGFAGTCNPARFPVSLGGMRPPALLFLLFLLLLGACTVIDVQRGARLDLRARWALLPVRDHGDGQQAGERVEELLATLLRTRLNVDPARCPAQKAQDPEPDEQQRYEQALAWARKGGFAYGLTGSVQEWHYRSGADGEAAVGLSLSVIDLTSGGTLWTASGSRSGWGRQTVSGVAQTLLRDLLARLADK